MPYNRKAFSDDYATETFYFPLSVQVDDEDSENLYDVTSGSVRWFEDEIQEAIDDYQSDIEMERYLCDDNEEIQRNSFIFLYRPIQPIGLQFLRQAAQRVPAVPAKNLNRMIRFENAIPSLQTLSINADAILLETDYFVNRVTHLFCHPQSTYFVKA